MSGSSALGAAVRQAARFDRAAISWPAGLLGALPVAGVVAFCVAIGQSVAAVTTGVGAMLVGVAWRATGGRPPLAVMATDTILMSASTFAGCITGRILWLHVVVLVIWSFLGGLLVALGRRPGVVGFQAILAVVAFGRFSEPIGPALGLAGLVGAGGLTEVGFLTLVRWPRPLAAQRRATAAAYRALAELASARPSATGLPAATALDEAAGSLASANLLGAPAVSVLRSLVTEGYRLRVAIAALNGLGAQLDGDRSPARALHAVAVDAEGLMRAVADTIEASTSVSADALGTIAARVSAAVEDLQRERAPAGVSAALWTALTRRLAALAGQLRAIASLAPAAGSDGGLRGRRPVARAGRPVGRLRGEAAALRANLSLESPALRHALRLALVVPLTTYLVRLLPVHRGYWVVIAAAAVLRPEFGATFTRGAERAGGTALGVAIAGLIAAAVHPSGGVTVAIAGGLAFLAFGTFEASYAVGFAFLTALVVFLLNLAVPDTISVAAARLIDTLIGATVGLLVFTVWPTWARRSAQSALADLVTSVRRYLLAVLGALADGTPLEGDARVLARAARLDRTRAEADVMRSLEEPASRRIDARVGPGVLSELRRVVQATHALRLEAEEDDARTEIPELAPLARQIGLGLGAVARALRTDALRLSAEQPDLRGALRRFIRTAAATRPTDGLPAGLEPVLDELVDAVNATAELVAPAA